MASSISPNMSLIVPGVGTEPGPTWASDLNASLGILDQHNHSPGQGIQITPAGININSNLPFNDNNVTTVKTVNFVAQPSSLAGTAPNLGCIYVAGKELVYNDESGNVVPITNNGSVNAGAGSITGLPNGTASASYNSGSQSFVWQSATSTPANLDAGSVIFRNLTSGSDGVTVNPPNALASNYSVTLPPTNSTGGTVLLTYDTSNNISIGPSLSTVGFNPAGTLIMSGSTVTPAGYLLCDGSSKLIASFPILAAALLDPGSGLYAFGSADSTHFNVPEGRGMFMRGMTGSTSNDPDASTRTALATNGNVGNALGSLQQWQIQSHTHGVAAIEGGGGFSGPPISAGTPGFSYTTNNTGGNQTNPLNVYINYYIKT